MTTITDANVHNVAVKGTFDDCQVGLGIALQVLPTYDHRIIGYRQSTFLRPRIQR
jgi:threonine synthase